MFSAKLDASASTSSVNVCCLRCRNNPGMRGHNPTAEILTSEDRNYILPYLPSRHHTICSKQHRFQSIAVLDTPTNHLAADASTKESYIPSNQSNCVRDKLGNSANHWQVA